MEAALKSFGIEDPTINEQLRREDPLLLSGPGLEMLSSPEGSSWGASPLAETDSSASSVYYNEGGTGKGVERDSATQARPTSILTEAVDMPPPTTPVPAYKGAVEASDSPVAKPPIPPRRSPVVAQSPFGDEAAETVEKDEERTDKEKPVKVEAEGEAEAEEGAETAGKETKKEEVAEEEEEDKFVEVAEHSKVDEPAKAK